MDVTQIPFAKHTGIKKEGAYTLKLEATDMVQNHLGTLHAGALYTLAETQSGLCLQEHFPELEGKVLALLRDATVKYKKPAVSSIYAIAEIKKATKEKFLSQYARKGRGSIVVDVVVKGSEDVVCMQGRYTWFVSNKLE